MSEGFRVRPVVVGVDGSAGSLAALRWAASQARLLRVPLVAVHAWEPTACLRAPYAPAATCRAPEEDRAGADEVLHTALRTALGPRPEGDVRAVPAEGRPAAVLLRYARGALLLALGRRAPDDAAPPALGHVARDCVRHAACPVVTVPAPAATPELFRTASSRPPARQGATGAVS